MGGKSSPDLALMVNTYGGATVIHCLASTAYNNWNKNRAIGQVRPVHKQDIEQVCYLYSTDNHKHLGMELIQTMISAANSDKRTDYLNLASLLGTINNLKPEDKNFVLASLESEPAIKEIAEQGNISNRRAEVYLAAYLAIRTDSHPERVFLNNLAIALELPKGLPAYLEQQADQGIEK